MPQRCGRIIDCPHLSAILPSITSNNWNYRHSRAASRTFCGVHHELACHKLTCNNSCHSLCRTRLSTGDLRSTTTPGLHSRSSSTVKQCVLIKCLSHFLQSRNNKCCGTNIPPRPSPNRSKPYPRVEKTQHNNHTYIHVHCGVYWRYHQAHKRYNLRENLHGQWLLRTLALHLDRLSLATR